MPTHIHTVGIPLITLLVELQTNVQEGLQERIQFFSPTLLHSTNLANRSYSPTANT